MSDTNLPALLDEGAADRIRCIWHDGRLFVSVVDVVGYLTDANIPRNYWSDLKRKLRAEGSEVHANIVQLKLRSPDGKLRTPVELALTSFVEAVSTETHQNRNSQGLVELQRDAQDAGRVGRVARLEAEAVTGQPVVSPTNYKQLRQERQRELQPPLFGDDQ
jgi:hypothetical protein